MKRRVERWLYGTLSPRGLRVFAAGQLDVGEFLRFPWVGRRPVILVAALVAVIGLDVALIRPPL